MNWVTSVAALVAVVLGLPRTGAHTGSPTLQEFTETAYAADDSSAIDALGIVHGLWTEPRVVSVARTPEEGTVCFIEGDIMVGPCHFSAELNHWVIDPVGRFAAERDYGFDASSPTTEQAAAAAHAAKMNTMSAPYRYSSRYWPHGVMPYEIDASAFGSANNVTAVYTRIVDAIAHWAAKTVIRLIPATNEVAKVRFISGTGCSSSVGRVGGLQYIRLLPPTSSSYCSFGAVVHEIGHALGLYHEQSRQDRDAYVTIRTQYIPSNRIHNFNKCSNCLNFSLYDYGSLMHYGEYAFTNTQGQRTITVNVTAHNEYKAIYGNINIGQRSGLSPLDASAINSLYDTCFTSSSSSTYYWRSNPYLPCDCALGASVRKSFCHSTTGACVAESECLSRGVSKPQTTRPCVADINCNFDSSTCGWDLTPNLNDDTDWRRWNGATPSQTTGPSVDHTTGTASGYYVYLEVTGRQEGQTAKMISPPMTFGGHYLTFWYHMYGSQLGSLSVETVTCAGVESTLLTFDANNTASSDVWRQAQVNLPSGTYKVQFTAVVGTGYRGDIAVDDVAVNGGVLPTGAPTPSPTPAPTTPMPTRAPTQSPTVAPGQPTMAPTPSPTTPAPTPVPVPCNPSPCTAGHGVCVPVTNPTAGGPIHRCRCYLGYTGANCSGVPNITITAPSAGAFSLSAGSQLNIRWTKQGNISSVSIVLVRQSACNSLSGLRFCLPVKVLAEGVTGNLYSWTVPNTLPVAADFIIRVFFSKTVHAETSPFAISGVCPSQACQNGGACVDNLCQCVGAYYGPTCSNNPCTSCSAGPCRPSVSCANSGICSVTNGTCSCAASYTGPSCVTPTSCALQCSNGGYGDASCTNCVCPGKWIGSTCQTCNMTCRRGSPNANCTSCGGCPFGFTGARCGIPYRVRRFRLAINFGVLSSNDARTAFINTILSDIARALRVSTARLRVTSLQQGSIWVTMWVLGLDPDASTPSTGAGQENNAKNLTFLDSELTKQMDNEQSTLYQGVATAFVEPGAEDNSGGGSSSAAIAIGVSVAVIVVIALVIGAVWWSRRRNRKANASGAYAPSPSPKQQDNVAKTIGMVRRTSFGGGHSLMPAASGAPKVPPRLPPRNSIAKQQQQWQQPQQQQQWQQPQQQQQQQQWQQPAAFASYAPAAQAYGEAEVAVARAGPTSSYDDPTYSQQQQQQQQEHPHYPWAVYTTDDGIPYYFNLETNQSVWDKPF